MTNHTSTPLVLSLSINEQLHAGTHCPRTTTHLSPMVAFLMAFLNVSSSLCKGSGSWSRNARMLCMCSTMPTAAATRMGSYVLKYSMIQPISQLASTLQESTSNIIYIHAVCAESRADRFLLRRFSASKYASRSSRMGVEEPNESLRLDVSSDLTLHEGQPHASSTSLLNICTKQTEHAYRGDGESSLMRGDEATALSGTEGRLR